MHPRFTQATGMTHDVIGAAIEVHKDERPGLLESIYEGCLTMELPLRGDRVQNQDIITIRYKPFQREESLRLDLQFDNCLLVEVRAVEEVLPIRKSSIGQRHETVGYPARIDHQFPYTQIDRWTVAVDPSRR